VLSDRSAAAAKDFVTGGNAARWGVLGTLTGVKPSIVTPVDKGKDDKNSVDFIASANETVKMQERRQYQDNDREMERIISKMIEDKDFDEINKENDDKIKN